MTLPALPRLDMAPPADVHERVHPLIATRRSPRAFDPGRQVDDRDLVSILDAARWAPSSMNAQPWRFLVARSEDEHFDEVVDALAEGNRRWAPHAGALIVAVAEVERAGRPIATAPYDLGLAVAQLTLQAHALGLATHQMGGFDRGRLSAALGIPVEYRPLAVIAVGHHGDPDQLPADLREREVAPRTRRPLTEVVAQRWGVQPGWLQA